MESFRDIIETWPSRQALADDTGASLARVHKWHQRNHIPPAYDWRLVTAAAARGIVLSYETLAKIRGAPALMDQVRARA